MWSTRTFSFHRFSQELVIKRRLHEKTSTREKLKILRCAYQSEGKYKSCLELAQDLARNIVYYNPKNDSSGVLVVNKPNGVPLRSSEEERTIGLIDSMPELAQILQVPKINVVKSTIRFSSGCVFLATKDSGANRIKNCLNRSNHLQYLGKSFYALTYGVPRKQSTNETVDVKMEQIRDLKNPISGKDFMEPVIDRILMSNRKLKNKDFTHERTTVHSEIIARSENGRSALFRIEPMSLRNNFLMIYCADMLSPIIGDHLFGYRAKMFGGNMIRVSPQHSSNIYQKTQKLPDWMLHQVGLKTGEEDILPLHLHLGRVVLPRFFGPDKDLIIHAPPRPYFMGTAEMLGIKIPDDMKEDNEIRKYTVIRSKKKNTEEITQVEECNV